jgi:hypothetical protein
MDFWAEGQGFDSPWLLSFFFFFFSSFFLASQGKFSKALHHAEVSYTHFGHMYPEPTPQGDHEYCQRYSP